MSQQQFEYEVMSQLEQIQYAEFLRANSNRPICNGDMLIQAVENGHMYEEFQESTKE